MHKFHIINISVFFIIHILKLFIVVCSTVTDWLLQYAKAALQSVQQGGSSCTLPSSTPSSATISSTSDNGHSQSSAQAVTSPSNIESQCRPTVSKRAKLFSFMSSSASNTSSQSPTQLTIADVEKQFELFSAEDVGGHGITVFNEKRFSALYYRWLVGLLCSQHQLYISCQWTCIKQCWSNNNAKSFKTIDGNVVEISFHEL